MVPVRAGRIMWHNQSRPGDNKGQEVKEIARESEGSHAAGTRSFLQPKGPESLGSVPERTAINSEIVNKTHPLGQYADKSGRKPGNGNSSSAGKEKGFFQPDIEYMQSSLRSGGEAPGQSANVNVQDSELKKEFQVNVEEPREKSVLSRDLSLYASLFNKIEQEAKARGDNLDLSREKYSKAAVRHVTFAKKEIFTAASYYGVPPEAVAACMLDEATTTASFSFKGMLDGTQDLTWANFPPIQLLGGNEVQKYSEMRKFSEQINVGKKIGKLEDRRTWDIGPYNVNISTGFIIFNDTVLGNTGDSPIKKLVENGLPENASVEDKWKSFINRCLLSPQGGAFIAGYVLKKSEEELAPYMRNIKSPEERAALIIGGFKQGTGRMIANWKQRAKLGDQSDMRIGEGARMIYNIEVIHDILYGRKAE